MLLVFLLVPMVVPYSLYCYWWYSFI